MEALGFRQYYFQFTLNDYVREGLEPNVPPVAERIDTFKRLAGRIGKEATGSDMVATVDYHSSGRV